MSNNYKCYRCNNYIADHKTSIYNHILKNKKCPLSISGLKYNHDELIKYSLCKKSDHKKFSNKMSKYNISKSTLEFIEELKYSYKNKIRTCKFCNNNFEKYCDLEYHLFECIEINDNINNCHIINNITNNNTNNINLIFRPKSFDEAWDVSHLSDAEKSALLLSVYKYTKTLELLLKNKNNHNIIIDKETDNGFVFIKDSLQTMPIKDICDKSFHKINHHLNDFVNEALNYNNNSSPEIDYVEHAKKVIDQKCRIYIQNKQEKDKVDKFIIDNFKNKKNDILNTLNEVITY